ncbi:transposase [Bacillus cereus group sp. MYBK234-1]|uniref:transposase n=1 Tax=Bacillus cereus group sp. MYBK234-1 TaxID=3450650 RepID=UPI003F7A0166
MEHVIAFDISMGKSYMIIYNAQKQCVFESEIKHSKPEFKKLQEKIHELTDKTGELPKIVFVPTPIKNHQILQRRKKRFKYFK